MTPTVCANTNLDEPWARLQWGPTRAQQRNWNVTAQRKAQRSPQVRPEVKECGALLPAAQTGSPDRLARPLKSLGLADAIFNGPGAQLRAEGWTGELREPQINAVPRIVWMRREVTTHT